MKIELTNKEHRTLLEILYISNWVLNAATNEDQSENQSHKALQQKLLSSLKDAQAEDLLKEYESEKFDEYMHENHIEPYNHNVFWESLLDQLSFRDLVKKIGMDRLNKLDPIERLDSLEEIRANYAEEFEQHQLEHLQIVGSK